MVATHTRGVDTKQKEWPMQSGALWRTAEEGERELEVKMPEFELREKSSLIQGITGPSHRQRGAARSVGVRLLVDSWVPHKGTHLWQTPGGQWAWAREACSSGGHGPALDDMCVRGRAGRPGAGAFRGPQAMLTAVPRLEGQGRLQGMGSGSHALAPVARGRF